MQRIIRKYNEQLLGNKLDNLKEMNKFLEAHNLPRLSHEETENMNTLITSNESVLEWLTESLLEIESVIKNKQNYKTRCLYWWILPNIQRKPILVKLFQKIEDNVTLPNRRPALPWHQNQKRKLHANIPDKNRMQKFSTKC